MLEEDTDSTFNFYFFYDYKSDNDELLGSSNSSTATKPFDDDSINDYNTIIRPLKCAGE